SNLVAHHLDALGEAGLIERVASASDRRRRYVRLRREPLGELVATAADPNGLVLFVCTHNSARSQLAAALWRTRTGGPAASAGTQPAARVHPGAVAAAERAGLDLGGATPAVLADDAPDEASLVVTVCDQAHEQLAPPPSWWHWSIPDPVAAGTDEAFDAVVSQLDDRIGALTMAVGRRR
ncbi:MAG: ArsR family transcriptional regulator, partial [Actinomycetota bacterium]